MDDIEATLDEVCALLGRVVGCAVLRSRVDGEHAVLDLIGERGALMALQDIFQAANADITPWLSVRDEVPCAVATQSVRASIACRDEVISHGSLQLVGIHVVWRLHRDGLMEASEANSYLLRWSAAPVAA